MAGTSGGGYGRSSRGRSQHGARPEYVAGRVCFPLWYRARLVGLLQGIPECQRRRSVQQGAAPEGMRSFTGTYRDPQKEEQWVIREAGIVSVRSSKSGRMLRGWVEDEALTVEFPNKTVRGWLEGQQLVWRSRALPWM